MVLTPTQSHIHNLGTKSNKKSPSNKVEIFFCFCTNNIYNIYYIYKRLNVNFDMGVITIIKPDDSTAYTVRPTHAYMGTCSTAAGTAAKTVTITPAIDNFLEAGVRITVYFSVANSAANPTLSINRGTAKKIYKGSSAITAELLSIGYHDFIYDGTQWQYVSSYIDTNTTYSAFTTAAAGLTPASGANKTKFLRGDGTWQTPTSTTYNVFNGSNNGLVPRPNSGQNNTNYILSGNGTWVANGGGGGANIAVDEYMGAQGGGAGSLGTVLPIDHYGKTNYTPYLYQAEGEDKIQVLVPAEPKNMQYALAVGMDDEGHLFIPITRELTTLLTEEMGYVKKGKE